MRGNRRIHDSDVLTARRHLLLAGSAPVFGGLAYRHGTAAAADDRGRPSHDHHQHAQGSRNIKRTEVTYKVPVLTLVRQDGARIEFPAQVDDGRLVILDFIYTSCAAVCPLTSQVLSQLQDKLGRDRGRVNMISISIDPEYDTPKRLAEYAKRFGATAQWQHYTGSVQASIAMQEAFDVLRGDKMNHVPVTFIRAVPGRPWVRLEGFSTPDELLREYRELVKGG